MRRDIEFSAEGVTLRGWLYLPEGAAGPVPTVVMAHGLSAVKEMYLDRYAEVFADAGLGALVFDNRCLGASDGEPRQEVDPWLQVRDYRHAITYARTLPEVDRERIGVWGSSLSGGHALVVGAIDRRVKCVVSQVPVVSGYRNLLRQIRPDLLPQVRAGFDADREARFAGKPPAMIPMVSEDPLGVCVLPHRDSWDWFSETARTRAPAWRNEVTLRSVEMIIEYEPAAYVDRISPTPLLLVVAANDTAAVADQAFEAYERALPPKRLHILPGGHFDAYVSEFDLAATAARDWLVEHLGATGAREPS
jgi:fermentation-respiration switch protein FrsA (DUF1100 family)